MKKILIIIAIHPIFLSRAQIYQLNTYTGVPNNAYIKDVNDELIMKGYGKVLGIIKRFR